MKTRLKQTILLGLMACVLAHLSLRASADSTADLILILKCKGGYNVNIWKRYGSGEILYRSTSPQGNLSLGKGTRENTGAAQVYKFKHGNYEYQVLEGKGDRQGQGTLEIFKNDRSILSRVCKQDG